MKVQTQSQWEMTYAGIGRIIRLGELAKKSGKKWLNLESMKAVYYDR